MNTRIYTWLYTQAANSIEILLDVQALFNSMERRLSRFLPTAELSRLNYTDGVFMAGPTLFEAVEVALWAAESTGGLFDPTMLTNLEHLGYNRSFETIRSDEPGPLTLPLPQPGQFRAVQLNPFTRAITKPGHIRLDLGGIGKGLTTDRAADRLAGLGPFLVNAGGDLYAYGAPPGETGWEITVPHPQAESRLVTTLRVRDKAVATSSITRRRWQQNGLVHHHLLDPRTGRSADTDLLSVTVIGERVATAEVFAKTALIIGAEYGLAYLESIPGVEGLLITQNNIYLQTTGFYRYQAPNRNSDSNHGGIYDCFNFAATRV